MSSLQNVSNKFAPGIQEANEEMQKTLQELVDDPTDPEKATAHNASTAKHTSVLTAYATIIKNIKDLLSLIYSKF